MYNLYQHVQKVQKLYLGQYDSLRTCQRATEVGWDILKQRGYVSAIFHCEKAETNEPSVGWVYKE